MQKFLEKIAGIFIQEGDIHQKILVVPNKRPGVFFKKALMDQLQKPILTPQILSIREFLQQYSPYQTIDNLNMLFEFYLSYQSVFKDQPQNFDDFIKWAPGILQDFNQIDAFDIDAKEVFNYIFEVKKIENWQLQPDSSKIQTEYLQFYASLYDLYNDFQKRLQDKNTAYHGMISRFVAKNLSDIVPLFQDRQIVFAGFNALTKTEEIIIKTLVEEKKATIYWDADTYYLKKGFEAGHFLRKHQQSFIPFKEISDNFSQPKEIEIIGVSGSTTQAQAVARILTKKIQSGENIEKTGIVLNEDDLLLPIINSLPPQINELNISLGLPLGQIPVTGLFEQIIRLYVEYERFGRFNLEIIESLLHQTYLERILSDKEIEQNKAVLKKIQQFKSNLITPDFLQNLLNESKSYLQKIVKKDFNTAFLFDLFLELIRFLSNKELTNTDGLALVKMEKIVQYLIDFQQKTKQINKAVTLQLLYNQLIRQERLTFEGEPLVGLQIMGMLETRLLDFEHVIITSVNEGILPSGKNDRSIIPFELKKHFGLPSYFEKNAIMSYHFYRLLQRASKVSLIYNNANNDWGFSEPGRFIAQLENELKSPHKIIHTQFVLSPAIKQQKEPEVIKKTPAIIQRLETIGNKGFSPSALNMYIRNPLLYYKHYILQLTEPDEISKEIPAYTIGTIIHDSLDDLYKPYEGKVLKQTDFISMKQHLPKTVLEHFVKNSFGEKIIPELKLINGKNLILFEVIQKNVMDIIRQDEKIVQKGHVLQIIDLEKEYIQPVDLENRKVFIKGKVDRVDRLDGQLRVIDYKTGTIKKGELNINQKDFDWSAIINPNKGKVFQLLTYAWLYHKTNYKASEHFATLNGVLSTRHIKQGLIPVEIQKNRTIDKEVLDAYETQLKLLLQEIFNMDIPFIETNSKY